MQPSQPPEDLAPDPGNIFRCNILSGMILYVAAKITPSFNLHVEVNDTRLFICLWRVQQAGYIRLQGVQDVGRVEIAC